MLQQYLPFTVLKLEMFNPFFSFAFVATVLTVYGIETTRQNFIFDYMIIIVATVLTVYGIETHVYRYVFQRS